MIELNKNQKIIIIVILILIIFVIIYYIWDTTQNSGIEEIEEIQEESIENKGMQNISSQEIIVHVAGAVENEGIQKLPENSRISDAINAAGGLTSDANSKNINLAQKVSDGQKIYIPNNTEDEEIVEQSSIINNATSNIGFSENNEPVNINTATQTEFETLPGIGPTTASKIISYRKENGNFKTIEDIQNVSGIGESKYSQIKDRITI